MPVIFDKESDTSYVEQIKRANREVYTLYELARVFNSSLSLEDTLSLFVKKVGELVPYNTCIVYLMDDSQDSATAAYVQGENKVILEDKRIKMGEGATGFVLKKRQPVYNINPNLDFPSNQLKLNREYSAMVSLPLIADQKTIGAVSIYSYDLKNYEEEHMRLLETVTRIASDAMAMALQYAESESQLLTDPITNMPNARALQPQFEAEAAHGERTGKGFNLLVLNLDDIKIINNTFGHQVGDLFLKQISTLIGNFLNEAFLARYTGYVFVAIIKNRSSNNMDELCNELEDAITNFQLPIRDKNFIQISANIAVSSFPKDGSTLDVLIQRANKSQ